MTALAGRRANPADPPRWDGAHCAGRPYEWDLDLLRNNPAGIAAAIHTCHTCPLEQPCYDFAAATKANGVIQGGTIWDRPDRRHHTCQLVGCQHRIGIRRLYYCSLEHQREADRRRKLAARVSQKAV